MRATVDGIGKWPWVNAEIRGNEAIIKRYVNLGMAVAVDDAKGLLVPVIKNAESLSMVGLARALTDLADRARSEDADRRRDERRLVHDHEPRRLRRARGHADHAGRHRRPSSTSARS